VAATLAVLAAACSPGPAAPRSAHRSTGTGAAATSTGATAPPVTSTTAPGAAGVPADWPTYGGGFGRDAVDATSPALEKGVTPAWTSPALDGAVYGEPLLYGGEVLVATESDTVYALSAADGTVAWSDHLATPVPSSALPCGDIAPTVGVTSTMVVDPASGTLFVSAARSNGGAVQHWVYALDVARHRLLWSRDVDQPGWTASAQLQRAGLALAGGDVVVGFGGNYGDCGAYHGWVVGVPETGTGAVLAYRVPTAREGAVWAPSGVTVDSSGDVFAVTGNGAAGPGRAFDHGNAVVELSPGLAERGYFAPSDWAQDSAGDLDLASTAAMAVGGSELFVVGKERTAYLLRADDLGGIGGQEASLPVCNARGGNAFLAPYAYVVCPDDGTVVQVRVGPGASLSRGWTWRSPTGGAGSPTIAGGVLWSIDPGASVLYGADLSTGATRYRLPLATGTPPHFAAPSAAGGLLVVAGARAVEAFR